MVFTMEESFGRLWIKLNEVNYFNYLRDEVKRNPQKEEKCKELWGKYERNKQYLPKERSVWRNWDSDNNFGLEVLVLNVSERSLEAFKTKCLRVKGVLRPRNKVNKKEMRKKWVINSAILEKWTNSSKVLWTGGENDWYRFSQKHLRGWSKWMGGWED